MVKKSISNVWGAGSVLGWGAKILHVSQPKNQNIEQKQHYSKFSTDFKNGSLKKKKKSVCTSPLCGQ